MTELTEAGRRVADMPAFPTRVGGVEWDTPGPTFFQHAALELMAAYRTPPLNGGADWVAGEAVADAAALCNKLGALQEGGAS